MLDCFFFVRMFTLICEDVLDFLAAKTVYNTRKKYVKLETYIVTYLVQ